MNVLIILAHPECQSFNAYLTDKARDTFQEQGHNVNVVDLYREDFDPREGAWHYRNRADNKRFDAMREQRHHWNTQQLPNDVQRHMDLLLQADRLILQFPFWWFGAPAILKGWMDRVFVYGGTYNSRQRYENGFMQGKSALLTVTAGSDENACAHNGLEGDMRLMLWPIMHALQYIGFTLLEPFLIRGVRDGLDAQQVKAQRLRLEQVTRDYQQKLGQWSGWPEIKFNKRQDFDEDLLLKPDAPEYSPFIRHRKDVWGV